MEKKILLPILILLSLFLIPIASAQLTGLGETVETIEITPSEVTITVDCPINCICDSEGNILSCEGVECPINCICDSEGNILSCEGVECPINCICDSEGNILSCEGVECPINCICDSEGNILSCEGVECPINCICDSEGNILSCEGVECPINCICDSEGNILSCEGVECPINCICDSEGNIIECEELACPEGCICIGDTVTCPTETKPIEVEISTETGVNVISIKKVSANTISIKTEKASAVTSEKLIVKESKLYIETSIGDKQINVLPEEASSKATEITTVNAIELKEEAKPIYSVKGTKEARILAIFPVTLEIETKVDAETGDVLSVSKPWWSFLAW